MKIYTSGYNRGRAGFSLIEIMVVVVILGVLAATIIPQFMGTTSDAKISSAKSHVAELSSALDRFYIHMDRHPTQEEGLEALVKAPEGSTGFMAWSLYQDAQAGSMESSIPIPDSQHSRFAWL
ncbi:MAG: type II secretion system protein GspG [Verrucomicrobia bacterium]|nr:type II secretion system protein GspG [Verrucomicrobiota bacterium]